MTIDYTRYYCEALPLDCWIVWVKDCEFPPEIREIATTEAEASRTVTNIKHSYRNYRPASGHPGIYRVWYEKAVLNHVFAEAELSTYKRNKKYY